MKRIIYIENNFLQSLAGRDFQEPDQVLTETVNQAVESLRKDLRQIIRARYFEALSVAAIAERNGMPEKEIIRLLYEAKRQLKMILADFAADRWGIKIRGRCRICLHDRRELIDCILLGRSSDESWAATSEKIKAAIGENFQPPQILKAHLKHLSDIGKGGK